MKIICVSGHLEYLERSKTLGDYLFVIVNSDFQAQLKKKKHL